MAENSKIEWTHHTFNPWWGCLKVSAECNNCYAATFAHRYGHEVWGPAKTTKRRMFSDKHWNETLKWNKEAAESGERKRVFCASMADVFEEHPQLNEPRQRLWKLIEATPNLDWLILTKRPENILKMLPDNLSSENIWHGTSVGVNDTKWRIDELIKCRNLAKVLFLSCEPLLEEIRIGKYLNYSKILPPYSDFEMLDELTATVKKNIDWVIVGGESGGGRRPFKTDWARSLREQCKVADVAFFMKQVDKVQPIPEDLLIREFPKV